MVHELTVLPVARDPAEKVLVPVDVVVECFDAVVVEVADAFVQRLIEGFLEVCSELAVDGVGVAESDTMNRCVLGAAVHV